MTRGLFQRLAAVFLLAATLAPLPSTAMVVPGGKAGQICRNDPVNFSDPLGLVAKQDWERKRVEMISRGGLWNVLALGSALGEAVLDVASLGAFGANDRLADREIAGEITESQYWSGVAVNTGARLAAVGTAGAAAPLAAGAVAGGVILQGAVGGAVGGLAYSATDVAVTRSGYAISDIEYERSLAADAKYVGLSTAGGTVFGTLLGATARADQILATRSAATLSQSAAKSPITDPARLLTGSEKLADHHVFPQQFRGWFQERGLQNIDNFTVTVDHNVTHLRAIHGSGNMSQMPGRWNAQWAEFIKSNPNASSLEVYQQAGRMMDDFGVGHVPIHPYKAP